MQNNNEQTIKITAVIPAYNAEKYIGRAIESILTQSLQVDEIIVVDDGSTDNTAEAVRSFGDKVKLIQQANAGECAARNSGIQAATSPWIAFLDADDEWLPDKIALQAECLRQNPSLVWVSSNYIRCLCDTNRKSPHLPPEKAKAYLKGRTYLPEFFRAFMTDSYGCSDTMLVQKQVLLEAGLFRPNQTRAGDMDMWWRIAFRYPQIGYVCSPLAVYHLGIPGSASVVFNNWQIYCDMIRRNLGEAEKFNRQDAFNPAATYMLKRWLRSMLFNEQKEGIRSMMTEFRSLLSPGYRFAMTILTMYPPVTAKCVKMLAGIVRRVGIRRTLSRPQS